MARNADECNKQVDAFCEQDSQNYVEVHDASALCGLVVKAGLSTHDSAVGTSGNVTQGPGDARAPRLPLSDSKEYSASHTETSLCRETSDNTGAGTHSCDSEGLSLDSTSASWRWCKGPEERRQAPSHGDYEDMYSGNMSSAAYAMARTPSEPSFYGVVSSTLVSNTSSHYHADAEDTHEGIVSVLDYFGVVEGCSVLCGASRMRRASGNDRRINLRLILDLLLWFIQRT